MLNLNIKIASRVKELAETHVYRRVYGEAILFL
jgi:hypothetical protein